MKTYKTKNASDLECEVLIIGSGAGGAAAGNALAKAGFDVLMLEEGPSVPTEEVPATQSESFSKMWRNGGMTLAYGPAPVAFSEGKCVGGSTEINSAIFQRVPDDLLAIWAKKFSINNFSSETLSGFYDTAAKLVNADVTSGDLGLHSKILKRASDQQHWKSDLLERGHRRCVGTNHCSIGCPTGAKQSMSTSILRDFVQYGGRLIPNCRVIDLVRTGSIIKGARAETQGEDRLLKTINITAKHVLVCGGATQTPSLLQRSKIKNKIGVGFKLHPTIRVLAEFDETVDAQKSRLPLYAITQFLPDYRLGGSLFTLPTYAMFLAEDWMNRSHMLPSYRNMGMYYAMARGSGDGIVKSIPFSKHAYVGYKLSEDDWAHLEAGLHNLSTALFEIGARKIQPSISGVQPWNSIDEMRDTLKHGLTRKKCNLMSIHLFSSIGMGENQALSAADSYGKIHEIENLYIADASLIPESPGVNPQATVMALSLRVAENFIEKNL